MDPAELREALVRYFNEDELRTLCADLDAQGLLDGGYDALAGATLKGKARELVDYFQRREALPALLRAIERIRPNLYWSNAAHDRTVPPAANQYATARMLVLTVGRLENRVDGLEREMREGFRRTDRDVGKLWVMGAAQLTAMLFILLSVVALVLNVILR